MDNRNIKRISDFFFQDILYGDHSGDVFQVLRYRQRKFANRPSFHIQPVNVGDQQNVEELVQFLNGCILPNDKVKLEQKLRETVDMRMALLFQNDVGYPKIFEFYLVDPTMVIQQLPTSKVTCT